MQRVTPGGQTPVFSALVEDGIMRNLVRVNDFGN